MSTGMSWKLTSFSRRQAKTLDTAVDMGGPYTFTGVAIEGSSSSSVWPIGIHHHSLYPVPPIYSGEATLPFFFPKVLEKGATFYPFSFTLPFTLPKLCYELLNPM